MTIKPLIAKNLPQPSAPDPGKGAQHPFTIPSSDLALNFENLLDDRPA
jgi:hypothetical protein